MVDEQKTEQRGQAVKRLRSLFDMHHIAFGAPESLGRLMLSLHENRHFAMDFWSVVNTLSEDGSGSLNEEEMLEAVVEGVTGANSSALPEYERPGVHELRLMLSGVDVARPAPIARPADALLADRTSADRPAANNVPVKTGVSASLGTLSLDDALQSRRSIGEALANLEQSTRELREQLSRIDAQLAQPVANSEAPGRPVDTRPLQAVAGNEQLADTVARWDSVASTPVTLEEPSRVQEDLEQTASPLAEAVPPRAPAPASTESFAQPPSHSAAAVLATAPVLPPGPAPQPLVAPSAPVDNPVASATMPPASVVAEKEVFAPKPVHTLSQRGLAIPEPDDDPFIVAPLSGYAADSASGKGVRYGIAAVVIVALAAAGFAGSRTQAGHEMLQSAGSAIRDGYNSLAGRSNATANVASNSAESQTEPTKSSTPTDQGPSVPAPQSQQASPSAATPNSQSVSSAATSSASPRQQPVPPAPVTSGVTPPSGADEKARVRQRAAQPFVDTSVLRVPASTMVANLITSRVPAYPGSARAQQIEGPVMLEAIISESGFVRYARAIEGDPHLRTAAEDAVLRYRYRPYLLDGTPVEVSTTVRIDFRLPQ